MGAEDTWGKLQKNTKLVILGALVFGSKRRLREKITFTSTCIFYHLARYLHLVNMVLASEFDEI